MDYRTQTTTSNKHLKSRNFLMSQAASPKPGPANSRSEDSSDQKWKPQQGSAASFPCGLNERRRNRRGTMC